MTVISAAVEANGWVLAVRGTWAATAGAWEYAGYDRTNGRFLSGGVDQFPLYPDSPDPKIMMQVASPGYERVAGLPVANPGRLRTLIATKAIRRPFPNQAQLDEIHHGDGTRTVRLALTQRVFANDVIQSASFLAGWKFGEAGVVPGVVVNGSTRTVQLPVSRWATVPYQLVSGTGASPRTSVRVDVLVASHFPEHVGSAYNQAVAAVAVQAFDGTNMGAVSWLTQGTSAEVDGLRCWTGEVDVRGLTAGVITLHKTLYPFIGAARSTGSAHVATALASTVPDWAQPLQLCFDPVGDRYAGKRKYVFIDTASPNALTSNSGSVVLHGDIASARAAAATTKPQNITVAIEAFRDQGIPYPNANGLTVATGRGCEFWEILIHEGQTVQPGSGTVTGSNFWNSREGFVVIRGDPAAANPRASCAIQSRGTAAGITVQRLKITGCRVLLGQSSLFSNATNNLQWLDDCDVTAKPGFAGDSFSVRASGNLWTTNLNCWGYSSQPAGALLQRNIVRSVGSRSMCHVNVTVNYEPGVSNTSYLFDVDDPDAMIWNFKAFRWNKTVIRADEQSSSPGTLGAWGSPHLLLRAALVNVLVEGDDTRLVQLGEEGYSQMNDCIWDGVTTVGDGVNFHNEPPWPILNFSGTTFEVGLEAHGLSVGNSVTISGCAPAGYNGTFTVASVQDANRFRIAISPAPGIMSTKGFVTLPGGAVRALRFWNLRHTGNTLLNVAFDRNATKNDVWRGDGEVTGNWEIVFGVGMQAKVHANRIAGSPQDWQYAYAGLRAYTDLSYAANGTDWWKFVNDATGHDGRVAAFYGDYRPGAGSPVLGRGRVSNIDRTLDGGVRGAQFAAGALGPAAGELSVLDAEISLHNLSDSGAGLRWAGRVVPNRADHVVTGGVAGLVPSGSATGERLPGVRTLVVEQEARTLRTAAD